MQIVIGVFKQFKYKLQSPWVVQSWHKAIILLMKMTQYSEQVAPVLVILGLHKDNTL